MYIVCVYIVYIYTHVHIYICVCVHVYIYFISGSAYVFSYNSSYNNSNSQWTQVAKLVASDGASNDQFGYSISVYDNIIAVGARSDDITNGGYDAGNIYMYIKCMHMYVYKYVCLYIHMCAYVYTFICI